jgi:hypothetical protein
MRSLDPPSWKRSTPIVLTSGQCGPTTRRRGLPRFLRFLLLVYNVTEDVLQIASVAPAM